MPHLTVEYSANLDGPVDFEALCRALLQALLDSGLVERGAPRVRAIRCDAFAIADDLAENGFVDMSLRLGAGRSQTEKRNLGDALIAAARPLLADQLTQPHFALSLEVREIDPDLSWKLNTMHARLRAQ
ncbi:MAG: 5-carboxymethyl-2-hydroxymuconate isomerase [Pelagibacterium sp. SCN 63-23]|nr:MAG: 5-carboxymethyl-2-hydroxymuconate isomerase [Pelagibacterium sp. SCN 63-23]